MRKLIDGRLAELFCLSCGRVCFPCHFGFCKACGHNQLEWRDIVTQEPICAELLYADEHQIALGEDL